MLRIPGERVSGADEHQAGPGLGDPHLQEAGGRRGKQVRWASLHLSSGRDAHKHPRLTSQPAISTVIARGGSGSAQELSRWEMDLPQSFGLGERELEGAPDIPQSLVGFPALPKLVDSQ